MTETEIQPQAMPSFLSTQSLDKGGYTIPDHQVQRFNDLLKEFSAIRSLARVDTVNTDHFEILQDENTADCGWVTEAQERPNTETPLLKTQKISIHEMYAKPKVSQKLLEDAAIDIESWLIQKVAEKMAALETTAFLYGSGQNMPQGMLSDLRSIQLQSADDLVKAQDMIAVRYANNNAWLVSPKALSFIRHMKDPTTGQFLWQPSLSQSQPQTLLGQRIVVCDQLGTQTDAHIVYGAFHNGYQIVDRLGMTVMKDPFSNKPFVEFYVRKRTGGAVIEPNALCALKLGEG